MEAWNSFLQTVFQFVKSLFTNVSKRMHRNAVVLTTGVAVVTVLTFTAGNFRGGGKNALVAFAETQQESEETEADLEETQAATEPETEQLLAENAQPETAEPESETAETENNADEHMGKEAGDETEVPSEETETEEETRADEASEGGQKEEAGLSQVADSETEEASSGQVFACSSDDYGVLLKIVQAEAGICDMKGKILVANVILNRVKSSEFPDTITGVVYEKSQFSPVIDGSINRCKVTDETIEAVDRALAGEDYSQGALYFMNRKTSAKKNVRWFDNHLEWLFQHGSHEFFK